MAVRLSPNLQQILYRLVGEGIRDASKRDSPPAPGRFPVVVRPETRVFLESQAKALGGSIAGIAGAILDGVALTTMHRDGGPFSLGSVAERFNLLIHEHRLSFPAAAEALKPMGITLHELSNAERLLEALNAERLAQIAKLFSINYDWLVGKSDQPGNSQGHAWYKNALGAAETMLAAMSEADEVELCVVCPEGTDFSRHDDSNWDKAPHFIPVLIRRRHLPGDECLELFDVWEEGRWSYWRCREQIKFVFFFAIWLMLGKKDGGRVPGHLHLKGHCVPNEDYVRLRDETAIPASVLAKSRHVDWHPDDYVMPNSPQAKDKEEWLRMRASDDNRSFFDAIEKLYDKATNVPNVSSSPLAQ